VKLLSRPNFMIVILLLLLLHSERSIQEIVLLYLFRLHTTEYSEKHPAVSVYGTFILF